MTPARRRRGFTLVELLIALVVGLIVVATATQFAVASFRTLSANRLREDLGRNARFVGMSLARDIQMAGVGMTEDVDVSTPNFGWVSVRGDTVIVLSGAGIGDNFLVPEYGLAPATGAPDPITPAGQGSCGPRCFDFRQLPGGGSPELATGRVALLRVGTVRRLFGIESYVPRAGVTDSFRLTCPNRATLLGLPHCLSGSLPLTHAAIVQPLVLTAYWRQDSLLMRGERVDGAGTLVGIPVADGLLAWQARVVFTNGVEAATVDTGGDGNADNDYDDVATVVVRATMRSANRDARVNDGQPYQRDYEWRVTPRNLAYERNRVP